MGARPEKSWRRVAWSMGAGAFYDLCFALAILFFSAQAAPLMGLELPPEMTYFRLNGILY